MGLEVVGAKEGALVGATVGAIVGAIVGALVLLPIKGLIHFTKIMIAIAKISATMMMVNINLL